MKSYPFPLICIFILSFETMQAQKFSKPETEFVKAENETFEVLYSPFVYFIQNKTNVKNNESELMYLDGTSAYGCDTDDTEIVLPEEDIYRIFKETFSQGELLQLSKERISICFVVLPEGNISEVDFLMKPNEALLAIPIERFERLDKELKKLKLKVGPITRQLQFNWISFRVNFSDVPIDLPPLEPTPGTIKME